MAASNEIYQFTGQLFHQLKSRGFSLKIEDFNDAVLLMPDFDGDYEDFKFRLASLVCISPPEQKDFYIIYDEVLAKNQTALQVLQNQHRQIRFQKRLWLAGGLALVLGAILLLFTLKDYNKEEKEIPVDYSATPEVTRLEDPDIRLSHHFHLDRFLENNSQIDKKKLRVRWTVDDSVVSDSVAFKHNFIDLKRHYYQVTLRSPEYKIDTLFKGNFLSRPKLHFVVNGSQTPPDIVLGDSITVAMHTNIAFRDSASVHLRTVTNKDSVVAVGKKAELLHLVPKTTGTYTFTGHVRKKFERQKEDTASYARSRPISVNVIAAPTLSVAVDRNNVVPSADIIKTNLLLRTVLLAAALLWLIFYFIFRRLRLGRIIRENKTEEKYKQATEKIKSEFQGRALPADVEWKDKNRLILKDSFLDNWNKGLVQNIQTDRYEINIASTIARTAKNVGIITPVRQRKVKQKRYIILVAKKSRRDTQFRLFDYLVQNLYNNNIPIDYYSYSDNFTIKDRNNEVVSFADITNYSRQNSLMVFGDGHLFINFRTNKVDVEIADKLSEWQNKILITPIPISDWSAEEKILQQEIAIVPAGIRGLLDIVRILNDESALYNYDQQTTAHFDFRNLKEIENYLEDAELFQWLCALAVYPKIYWELIIAMGDALFPEKVNYANLLKFTRISWVNEAAFPVDIRLAMLKALSEENEIKARVLLLSLINDDLAGMTENSFSYEEKQIQQFTNSFVLAGTGHPQFDTPAIKAGAGQFIALYKTGNINDNALKIYLDNKDNSWQTPIAENLGAKAYIDNYEEENALDDAKQIARKSGWKPVLASLVATIMLLLLPLPIIAIIGKNTPFSNYFYVKQLQPQTNYDFKLAAAECWSAKDKLQWTIADESDSLHQMHFAGSAIKIPVDSLEPEKPYSIKVTNGNTKFSGIFMPRQFENYMVTVDCRKTPIAAPVIVDNHRDTISIQYDNRNLKAQVDTLVRHLQREHYAVKTVLLPFDGGNEIHYYTAAQLPLAKDLLQFTGTDFRVRKYEMSLPEKGTNSIKIFVKGVPPSAVNISIQYFPKEEKEKAEKFRLKINADGIFKCDGVDFEDPKGRSQVRYFSDADFNAAADLQQLAEKYFNQRIQIVRTKGNAKSPIELWISADIYKIRILTNSELTNNLKSVQASVRDKIIKMSAKSGFTANTSFAETDKRYYYGVVYYDASDAQMAKQISVVLGNINYKDQNGNGHSAMLMPIFTDNKARKGDFDIYVRADDAPCKSYKSGDTYTIYFDNDNKMTSGSELLLGKSGAIRVYDNTQIFTEVVTYTRNTDGKGTAKGAAMASKVVDFLYSMGMDLKNVKTSHEYVNTDGACEERVEVIITYRK